MDASHLDPDQPSEDKTDDAVAKVHDDARETARDKEAKGVQYQMGLGTAEQLFAGQMVSASVHAARRREDADEQNSKRQTEDILFNSLLDRLRQELADTRARREALEDELIEEFGENFVVENAKMYLDPERLDRLPGETDDQYRERLERELADKMLNPDGSIKADYKHLKIAQWLKEKAQEKRLENEISEAERKMRDLEERQARGEDISVERAQLVQQMRDYKLNSDEPAASKVATDFAKSVVGEATIAPEADRSPGDGFAALGPPPPKNG